MEMIILSKKEKSEILIGILEGRDFNKYRLLTSSDLYILKEYGTYIKGYNHMMFEEFKLDEIQFYKQQKYYYMYE